MQYVEVKTSPNCTVIHKSVYVGVLFLEPGGNGNNFPYYVSLRTVSNHDSIWIKRKSTLYVMGNIRAMVDLVHFQRLEV